MSAIRYEALKALKTAIEAGVTDLAGKVVIGAADPERSSKYPGLAIVPHTLRYDPQQSDEVYEEDDPVSGAPTSTLVENVGCFTGRVELRLNAVSMPKREDIEEAIIDLFLAREGGPGVLVVEIPDITIGGTATLYHAPVAYTLDNAEWREEMVFEHHRFTYLDVDLTFPALKASEVATIDQFYLAINHDLDSDTPLETVQIDEAGEVT